MTDTITILGLAGSLRHGSFNADLLRAAAATASAGCMVDIASLRGIPLYKGDVEEATDVPDVVETLKERVAAADGLLLVTPEANNALPGVFKNTIDWLSRPLQDIPPVSRAPSPHGGGWRSASGGRYVTCGWTKRLRQHGSLAAGRQRSPTPTP